MHTFLALLKKELLLEWRQRYALNGIILYLVSTIFVCYQSFNVKTGDLSPITWNALFWLIILFAGINTISKSFMQESEGRFMFYYTLFSPQQLILSKIVYNVLLMLTIGGLGLLFYSVVLGNPVQDLGMFILALALGAVGFSTTLTLIAGIAAKAAQSSTLMAVLGFPLILPMLLMLIRLSKQAIDGLDRSLATDEIGVLLALNLIVTALSWLLFPYLWRS